MKRFVKLLIMVSIIALCVITIKKPNLTFTFVQKTKSIFNEYVLNDEGKASSTVYYKTKDDYIVPIRRYIKKEDKKINRIYYYLEDTGNNVKLAQSAGLEAPLISGFIRDVKVEDGLAKVYLDKQKDLYTNKKDEETFITCTVYTLTEYKKVTSVKFVMDDSSKLKNGTSINKNYYRENINKLNFDKLSNTKETIYLCVKCGNVYNYVPFTAYSTNKKTSIEQTIKNHYNLSKNTKFCNLDFPKGANIEEILIKDDTLYIRLNYDFSTMDKAMFSMYKKSLCLTIKENIDSVKKVRFMTNQKDKKGVIIETMLVEDYKNDIKN